MIFKYTLIIVLMSSTLFSQEMNKIIIKGIAENSKAGAIVITQNKEVYYLEGIQSWKDEYFKKNVVVEGNLVIENHDEGMLMNDKGEYSQGFSGEIKKILKPKWKLAIKLFANDSMLENLSKTLPGNWNMKIEKKKLIISCSDTSYLIYENTINAENNSETPLREEEFKKYGKLINSQFVFILKNKLSRQDIKNIESENQEIYETILKLPGKPIDIEISDKDGEYWPQNKKEEKIVADYKKERNKLEKKMTKLPNYQSEKFALYLATEIGITTEFNSIFPRKNAMEMYRIKKEVFEKVLELVQDFY